MPTQPRTSTSAVAAAPPGSAAPADARLKLVREAISRPDVKAISTDIFDTLVWRQVAEPADAFELIGERLRSTGRLADGLSPAGFAALRREAEIEARLRRMREAGQAELPLDEIYALLPGWVFAGHPAADALEAEIEVERELIVPDLDVAELLIAAGRAGKRVVAVSDTYFTEAHLRRLLDQPVLADVPLDAIFASSEHRLGKSGGLFGIAVSELGVRPEAVVHFGDNPEADVHYPAELGIECHLFERRPAQLAQMVEAEARLQGARPAREPAPEGEVRAQVELTALRGKVAARRAGAELPSALRPFWQHGAVALGPVFTGFAEWAQHHAADLGATHLHCFMREGAFLGDLIDRAGEYLGTDVRTSPLWLNREVLARATISTGERDELGPLLVRRRTPTVEGFLGSLGVQLHQLPRFASHARTRLDDPDTRDHLLDALAGDDAVRATIVEEARISRERVVRYVERLLDGGDRLTVVDLGWAASAQGLLAKALAQGGLRVDISGLYLVLHRGAARHVFDGTHVRGYLGEYGAPQEVVDAVVRSPEILEQVCMPDHGSQRALDDDLEPVLAPATRSPVQNAESEAVRDGVRAFQAEWARYRRALPGRLSGLAGEADVIRPLLTRAVVAPTELEAAIFGAWMHDENQGSAAVEHVVSPELVGRMRHLDPDALRRLPMQELYWPFGLASQVDATWGELMTLAASGRIPWEALSGEGDTGPLRIAVSQGTRVPGDQRLSVVPKRNRFGLSFVRTTLMAPAIREIEIRPTTHPAVVRLDYLEVRCHVQGAEEPVVLRLDSPGDFLRLRRVNCFVLNPGIFVVNRPDPVLLLDLVPDTTATVFRVDVACGFATLAMSEMLPAPARMRPVAEAGVRLKRLEWELATLKGSLPPGAVKALKRIRRLGGG